MLYTKLAIQIAIIYLLVLSERENSYALLNSYYLSTSVKRKRK